MPDDEHPTFRYPDGKTRGEEAHDSMVMLAGAMVAGVIAVAVVAITAYLLFG